MATVVTRSTLVVAVVVTTSTFVAALVVGTRTFLSAVDVSSFYPLDVCLMAEFLFRRCHCLLNG